MKYYAEAVVNMIKKVWHSLWDSQPEFTFNRQPFDTPYVSPPIASPPTASPPVVAPVDKKPRVKRAATLRQLLDSVEHSFEAVGCPTHWGWSHTCKDTVIALRRLGPHIGTEFAHTITRTKLSATALAGKASALMFVSYPKTEGVPDNWMDSVFSYALVLKKSPWYVSKHPGKAIYECGAAWKSEKNKKLLWGNWYIALDRKTGEVEVCSVLNQKETRIKDYTYVNKVWGEPSMASADFCNVQANEGASVLRTVFIDCYESWQIMDSVWKVSVVKEGQRVTWTVPQGETKYFFADRDTTVTDAKGARKKIIHHVAQHVRKTEAGESMVREHIRGLGNFNWRGYAVKVISPKFHVTANDFDAGALGERETIRGNKKLVYTSKLGQVLANAELRGVRKPLPPITY